MSTLAHISLALRKLGPRGTVILIAEKYAKKNKLKQLLALPKASHKQVEIIDTTEEHFDLSILLPEKEKILAIASQILADKHLVFSVAHQLHTVNDPWNYDPIEKKYWGKQQYEETQLRLADVPRDVKIVWEVNRFKYLPLVAEAALLSNDDRYTTEILWQIHSWIEGNPFAQTINWSSPLELAIRAIAWLSALRLLQLGGIEVINDTIKQSLWQHIYYLHSQLSVDKIVKTNHLIGEAAGLYIVASLCSFPEAKIFRKRAASILETEIIAQTSPDGVSRESSGWYHCFVTDFFDLAERSSSLSGESFSNRYLERLGAMKTYAASLIAPDSEIVRYGDGDDGSALYVSDQCKNLIFGESKISALKRKNYFSDAHHITAQVGASYVFMRQGKFGWGDDGFASHAHDDLLSPIVYLSGLPVLVDSGTFVYNGDHPTRDYYRSAEAHNGVIIGESSPAVIKESFGWSKVRENATVRVTGDSENIFTFEASYGEYQRQHTRSCELNADSFIVSDLFTLSKEQPVALNFHFDPRWSLTKESETKVVLKDAQDHQVVLLISGVNASVVVFEYDFSPKYQVAIPAKGIRITINAHHSALRIELTRTS